MDSDQVKKTVYKIGHPLTGTVVGYEQPLNYNGLLYGAKVLLKTSSDYKIVLPFEYLFDEIKDFDASLFPELGRQMELVVMNHINDTLYVSSKPSSLEPEEIQKHKDFYEFMENNKEGSLISGIVTKATHFGLFVDLEAPGIGLVNIVNSKLHGGTKLPFNNSEWPKEGER